VLQARTALAIDVANATRERKLGRIEPES
jgi:hypothetical protein